MAWDKSNNKIGSFVIVTPALNPAPFSIKYKYYLDVQSNIIDFENKNLGIRVMKIRSCPAKFSDNIILGYGLGLKARNGF